MKYLLVKFAARDGYWDTSGYCHWSKEEYFRETEFDLDDEQGIIDSIGEFRSEYPRGEIYLYKIENTEWGSDGCNHIQDIIATGVDAGKTLIVEKEKKIKQREIEIERLRKKREEECELAQLKKLQEKYSANSR